MRVVKLPKVKITDLLDNQSTYQRSRVFNIFFSFLLKRHIVNTIWNHLSEVIPKSIHNMRFYGESDRILEYCLICILGKGSG